LNYPDVSFFAYEYVLITQTLSRNTKSLLVNLSFTENRMLPGKQEAVYSERIRGYEGKAVG